MSTYRFSNNCRAWKHRTEKVHGDIYLVSHLAAENLKSRHSASFAWSLWISNRNNDSILCLYSAYIHWLCFSCLFKRHGHLSSSSPNFKVYIFICLTIWPTKLLVTHSVDSSGQNYYYWKVTLHYCPVPEKRSAKMVPFLGAEMAGNRHISYPELYSILEAAILLTQAYWIHLLATDGFFLREASLD